MRSLADLLLIVLMMMAGAWAGMWLGSVPVSTNDMMVLLGAMVGGASGATTAYLVLAAHRSAMRRSRTSQRRTSKAAVKVQPPLPFSTRMAHFTGKRESEVLKEDNFESKMPFWAAATTWLRFPPKSGEIIRRYLLSIRRALNR